MQNHRVKSSTRGGGFCLCSRGFNRRGLWFLGGWAFGFLGGWAIAFLWMGDRIFGWMGDRI